MRGARGILARAQVAAEAAVAAAVAAKLEPWCAAARDGTPRGSPFAEATSWCGCSRGIKAGRTRGIKAGRTATGRQSIRQKGQERDPQVVYNGRPYIALAQRQRVDDAGHARHERTGTASSSRSVSGATRSPRWRCVRIRIPAPDDGDARSRESSRIGGPSGIVWREGRRDRNFFTLKW